MMDSFRPALVSVDTARAMLGGIGKTQIYKYLNFGELESVKLGKRRLIRVSSIDALIDKAGEER